MRDRHKRVVGQETRDAMKKILADIQSGEFAKEWIAENENGRPNFDRMRDAGQLGESLAERLDTELDLDEPKAGDVKLTKYFERASIGLQFGEGSSQIIRLML